MWWENVKIILKKRNISIYRLAKMTGINANTLGNYNNGHEPTISKAIKIADALNVSLDELRSK